MKDQEIIPITRTNKWNNLMLKFSIVIGDRQTHDSDKVKSALKSASRYEPQHSIPRP
jgi:hypothetical protein